ncbi:MAG TPA: DUF992 domain-containing protein [Rhizomicrobium sp.]|nr:DUF992 domain-containing protein [Rhizomicrobium sp.]
MSKNLSRLSGALALAAAAAVAFGAPAKAEGVKVGVLTCHESSGWGFIFGSSKSIHCIYHHGPYAERYRGDVSKFGVDIGYTSSAVIVWDVFAPNTGPERGALAGHYVGVQGSAAVGAGAGVNALVGGFNRSFTLQPVSIQGETGLNVAAGIGDMTLHYVGPDERMGGMDRDRDRMGPPPSDDEPPPPPH